MRSQDSSSEIAVQLQPLPYAHTSSSEDSSSEIAVQLQRRDSKQWKYDKFYYSNRILFNITIIINLILYSHDPLK